MSKCRVVWNKIPEIRKRLPREVDEAVDDVANSIGDGIREIAWHDTGIAISTTKSVTNGRQMHSRVGIGTDRKAFYVIFQEFGAYNTWAHRRLGPDPRVQPVAHQHEPMLARRVGEAVQIAASV